jgi:platelet-activating factor acetylhydrolase
MVKREFKDLLESFAQTATGSLQVYTIGGSTHPSFSDVFLILPHAINKMTGLSCSAHAVIDRIVRATEEYLSGEGGHSGHVTHDEVFCDSEDMDWKIAIKGRRGRAKRVAEKMKGKMYMSVGKPGELAQYRFGTES